MAVAFHKDLVGREASCHNYHERAVSHHTHPEAAARILGKCSRHFSCHLADCSPAVVGRSSVHNRHRKSPGEVASLTPHMRPVMTVLDCICLCHLASWTLALEAGEAASIRRGREPACRCLALQNCFLISAATSLPHEC